MQRKRRIVRAVIALVVLVLVFGVRAEDTIGSVLDEEEFRQFLALSLDPRIQLYDPLLRDGTIAKAEATVDTQLRRDLILKSIRGHVQWPPATP